MKKESRIEDCRCRMMNGAVRVDCEWCEGSGAVRVTRETLSAAEIAERKGQCKHYDTRHLRTSGGVSTTEDSTAYQEEDADVTFRRFLGIRGDS